MNQKEVGELRRRFSPDRNAVSRIYGCYVNGSGEIISCIDQSLGTMPLEESEAYLGLFKKSLSGAVGRSLIDISFSTAQVMDSDEHRLLSALRDSALQDDETRQAFFRKVIDSLDMDGANYLILLAHDRYDVPFRGGDGETLPDSGDEVFSYILCCICPVKDGKAALGYSSGDNGFHRLAASQIVAAPELGFLFPAFDNRTANLYSVLFYSRDADKLHREFIDGVFRTEPPLSAAEQKESFQTALGEALDNACSLDVVQSVHEQLCEKIELHRESRDPEPLTLTAQDVGCILQDCGVEQEHVAAFCEKCDEQFGPSAALSPQNLIDSKRFEVKTTDVTITVTPESSYLLETRIIGGRPYLLVPVGDGIEVNGLPVGIRLPEQENQPV